MRRGSGRAGAACAIAFGIACALTPSSASAGEHLLITEIGIFPTDGEFVEIHNTTGAAVDFRARFPAGATIGPGETRVVALHDDVQFTGFWQTFQGAAVPDFEMVQDGDAIPDMVDPGPGTVGVHLIQTDAGLSNAREVVILFRWDGASDLVEDVDIAQWSDSGPQFPTVSPNKTGVSVDGPDPDVQASTYLPDTPAPSQDLVATQSHALGRTFARIDLDEGAETTAGGNGTGGHDETSENLSVTRAPNEPPTIGFVGGAVPVIPDSWARVKARHRSSGRGK